MVTQIRLGLHYLYFATLPNEVYIDLQVRLLTMQYSQSYVDISTLQAGVPIIGQIYIFSDT